MWTFIIILLLVFIVGFVMFATKVFQVKAILHKKTPADKGILFNEVRFPTKNNLTLYGWWIPHKEGSKMPTIILVHGWKRNLERMMPYIENLHGSFNLLAFDVRSHGSSDKDNYSSMPRFAEDIESAVNFLYLQNEDTPEIGVIGLSIGGAAAIYEASSDSRVKRIVTVGAFADPGEVTKLQMNNHNIPYFPIGWMILNYVQFKIRKRFKDIAPEKNIAKTNAKILLIHGKNDKTAPYEHAERLYHAAAHGKATLWGLEGKGHSDCHKHPGFWNRVRSFLEAGL